jgi:DNA mismatch repair protein MutS2
VLSTTSDTIRNTTLNFRPEIDVRGMRADECMEKISRFVDDAVVTSSHHLRILHGTGNGILRQLIRQYLSTVPEVISFHDEHPQFGGAGITVVEMG